MSTRKRRNFSIIMMAATTLAAVTGCLLTTGLDGFSGSQRDSGLPDGPAEGSADATPPVVDGGADAGNDAGEAAAPDFRCVALVPTPTFCTDFDDGPLSTLIGTPNTFVGGVAALDDQIFLSRGRSLRVSTPSLANGGGTARASVGRKFGFAPSTSILIAMDIRIDSLDKSSTNTINLGMGGYVLTTFLGQTATKIREGVPNDAGVLAYTFSDRSPPKFGEWIHLTLTIQFGDGGSTVILAYDGVPQSALPIVINQFRSATWSVDLGLNFVDSPDMGRDIHVDNLVIDAK